MKFEDILPAMRMGQWCKPLSVTQGTNNWMEYKMNGQELFWRSWDRDHYTAPSRVDDGIRPFELTCDWELVIEKNRNKLQVSKDCHYCRHWNGGTGTQACSVCHGHSGWVPQE